MSLTASITSITIHGFKLADPVTNLPIVGPQWQVQGPGESRPAAVLRGGETAIDVEIEVSESEDVPPDLILEGVFGSMRVRSDALNLTIGSRRIRAVLRGPDVGFQHHAGQMAWRLRNADGFFLGLGRTQFELFELYGRPIEAFGVNGVPVEALRFLAEPVGLVGVTGEQPAVAALTRYCHSHHGMRYIGRYTFIDNSCGGTFPLSRYLRRDPLLASCYDQTGAVQALAGAIGIEVLFRRMEQFGFLAVLNLVGLGPTNNPNFGSGRQPRILQEPGQFLNHSFCEFEGGVYDACVGPFLGDLPPEEYLEQVYDPGLGGVGVEKIDACPGVSQVI